MNLLFDLDGTLTDSYRGIARCIAHALVTLGKPSPPHMSLRWCIGPPLKSSFATLLGSDDKDLTDAAISIYRERFGTVGMFENEVYEGIPEALQALLDFGHTLFVATSKPRFYAEQIVDHFGLRRYFNSIHGSELDGTRGDKTNLISYILQVESIHANDTSMIGDRKHDILGAKANGLGAFGVLWGYGTKEELMTAGARACFANHQALVSAFNGKAG